MSIGMLIAGYAFTLVVALLGCIAIARSRHASRGIWWVVSALSAELAAVLLFAGIGVFPGFFTIVLANEAVLIALVLIHQAVASTLDSPHRYAALGVLLVIGQFLLFFHYTYGAPNMGARAMVRSGAIAIQVAATVAVLFRHKNRALRHSARAAAWVFAAFFLLQTSELVANAIWEPTLDRLHPDPIQAFYNLFNFMLGMGCSVAVVWLALSAQRQDLQVMATTDGLSGLMNRGAFDEALERELGRSHRKRKPLALLLIDLDHFKTVNDEYGHQVGDEVIRCVSRLLRAHVRPTDAVARYGGEEFAIMLKGMQFDEAEVVSERLRAQIEQMPDLPDSLAVTASIGLAMRRASDTTETLFKRSDEALYLSKRLGRNRVSALEFAYEEC